MNKYVVIISLLLVSGVARAMELIEKQDKEKSYKTLKEAKWPSVNENSYIHTLDLQQQSLTTFGGLAQCMPEAINKDAIISLDVSHNCLQDLDMWTIASCLRCLKNCNASHNQLTEVPAFSQYMRRLKRLNLRGNLIKAYCIDDFTPEKELDLSDNPLDSLTWADSIDWRKQKREATVLRLCNTRLSDVQVQEIREKYAQVVNKKSAQCNVLSGAGWTGGISAFVLTLGSILGESASGNLVIEGSSVGSGLLIIVGSLGVGTSLSALTYGALRWCCCKQVIEDEKLQAEQMALNNIISENIQDDQGELIELDFSE